MPLTTTKNVVTNRKDEGKCMWIPFIHSLKTPHLKLQTTLKVAVRQFRMSGYFETLEAKTYQR